jgi:hypothetical protein
MLPTLSVRDHMTLQLAAALYKYPGARETDAHELVGMSPVIFHRHVNELIDDPGALAAYPLEVKRLRRLRDGRRRARAGVRGVSVATNDRR